MQANTDKFQAICIGKKTYEAIKHSQINDTVIQCESNVTLLCVNIDFMLSFNDHVREICKKKKKYIYIYIYRNHIKTTCCLKEREIVNKAREINNIIIMSLSKEDDIFSKTC